VNLTVLVGLAVFIGLAATGLWVGYLRSRNAKSENRQVGYRREEIEINAAAVPEFKPTWRDMRAEGEGR
jgi:hypothetical protein